MQEYTKPIELCDGTVSGYRVFCDVLHPLVNKCGYVYYHRHVLSVKIGRWLEKTEHCHHIDGNKLNNDPNNLELLSASEHISLHVEPLVIKRKRKCPNCGKWTLRVGSGNTKLVYCGADCHSKGRLKIDWPTPEEMKKLVWEKSTVKLAADLGVSDKAIEKFCKKNQIEKPPRGYWRKIETGNFPLV